MIKKNRALRRYEKSVHKNKAKNSRYDDPLVNQTTDFKLQLIERDKNPRCVRGFYSNDMISIQEFEYEDMFVLGFRHNTQKKDIPWSVKQYWKNKLGYESFFGYEAFPSITETVDEANMYWIMIPKKDIKLKIFDRKFFPDA